MNVPSVIFQIDLTLSVAIVTENVILDHILEVLQIVFQNLDISTAKYQKDILILCVSCYHLSSIYRSFL